jgi:hypothetical protein
VTRLARPRKRPCPSCPYRRDVPSGIWAASEYDALAGYDGDTTAQVTAAAYSVLFCHQVNGAVCAGWAGCHDMDENLAIRLAHRIVDVVFLRQYTTGVPLFGSGAEAAAHGKRDIRRPGPAAQRLRVKVATARALRGDPVIFDPPRRRPRRTPGRTGK